MDLLLGADDSVSHGRTRLLAPSESTYGAVNYTMHLNRASQMEISPFTPLFELLGGTWQMKPPVLMRDEKLPTVCDSLIVLFPFKGPFFKEPGRLDSPKKTQK